MSIYSKSSDEYSIAKIFNYGMIADDKITCINN